MRFYRDSFWNFVNLLILSLGSFLIIIIVGRTLSIEDFGLYSYILRIITAFSFILVSIAMFVFSHYFQKVEDERRSEIFYTVLIILSILALVLVPIMMAFSRSIAPFDTTSFGLFNFGIVLLLFYIVKGIYSEAFNALFEFRRRAAIEIIRSIVWLLVIAALALQNKLNLFTAILPIYFVQTIYIIGGHMSLKDTLKKARLSFSRSLEILRSTSEKTKFFIPGTSFNFLLTFLTFLFLARFWGGKSLGIFSYSFYFAFILSTIAAAMANTLLPYSAKIGPQKISKYLGKSESILIYLFIPLIIGGSFSSNTLMKLIFNREILGIEEQLTFIFLLVAFFLKAIAGNIGSVLNGIGCTKDTFKIATSTLLIQITLGLTLVYRFSILGGALSLMSIYLIQFLLGIYYVVKNGVAIQLYSPIGLARLKEYD